MSFLWAGTGGRGLFKNIFEDPMVVNVKQLNMNIIYMSTQGQRQKLFFFWWWGSMWVIHLLVKSKAWAKGLLPVINKTSEVIFLRVAFNLVRHLKCCCVYIWA